MNHPIIASSNGHERYNRMLKEGDDYRRAKAVSGDRPKVTFFTKLRDFFSAQAPLEVGKSVDSPA